MEIGQAIELLKTQIEGRYRVSCCEYHLHSSKCLYFQDEATESIYVVLKRIERLEELLNSFKDEIAINIEG